MSCDNCGEKASRYYDCNGDKLCPDCASEWQTDESPLNEIYDDNIEDEDE